MTNISYPAIFHIAEDVGGYWVEFPDLPGCVTQGQTEKEAYATAQDALALWLDRTGEDFERDVTAPSVYDDIIRKYPDELIMMVSLD